MRTADTGAITIATVTVKTETRGTSGVNLSVSALGDEPGTDYTVTGTNNATLTAGDVGQPSPTLALAGGSVAPSTVDESTTVSHDVGAVFENVSQDGNTDRFYVTFPNGVAGANLSADSASVETVGGTPVSISSSISQVDGPDADGVMDTLTFAVSPDATGVVDVIANVSVDVTWPAVDSDTAYTIQAAAEDSSTGNVSLTDIASVTVTDRAIATFEVSNLDAPASAVAGEPITVTYEVTNTGDLGDTQDLVFAVNGTTEDIESGITLNESEIFRGQFSYTTVAGDEPGVDVTVSSEDDSATETVTVNEPPLFDVTLTSVNSSVTEGETLTVAYEVTNTGGVQDTQDLVFAVNGTTEDIESGVTLNGGETFSGQFSYTTVAGDAPAVDVTVSSENDSVTETVTVNEPANFEVTLTGVNSSVTEGETITAAYEVTNTGDVGDTQDLVFAVNGTTEDIESGVTLNGSETFSGQFSYTTVAGDAPAVTVAVSSTDDTASETVTVNEPASFEVTLTSVNSSVTEGEPITVAYEVTNTGGVQDTQDLVFAVNGTTEDIESGVTLNGSETFSGQLSYQTVAGDAPAVSVTVSSQDDSASEAVRVNEPATFEVSNLQAPATAQQGTSINVSAVVTNVGDVRGSTTAAFEFNGTALLNETIALDPGNATNVSFQVSTENISTGNYTHRIVAGSGSESAQITITAANETDTPQRISPGQPGFGVGVAVAALLALIVLARRRD